MSFKGDMGPNMDTTINKIACTTNGQKLNRTSHTLFKCASRHYTLLLSLNVERVFSLCFGGDGETGTQP
ncbi:hypothetical protein E2C01_023304 [Portunus trituberculatus]|uniref:Uncharacterized protein n=1 Tax=Portunus trituberculatus TaxID=210409 RepID=A0A5B7E7N3_PORTR|nr:hypothetical protein [Portunus trituberculatus]